MNGKFYLVLGVLVLGLLVGGHWMGRKIGGLECQRDNAVSVGEQSSENLARAGALVAANRRAGASALRCRMCQTYTTGGGDCSAVCAGLGNGE